LPPVRRREAKPAVAPSQDTLRMVLAKCGPVAKDAAVTTWLRSRGLDGLGVEGGAFALPAGVAGLPRFAAPWPHTGHRLVMQVYDAHGRLATLRARSIGEAQPKSRAPRGGPTTGVVLANAGGLAILRGDAGAPEDVLICEGEPDTLTATMHGIAAIGVVSGDSWTPEIGRKLWGRRLTLALHDDAAGDAYAAGVLRSVSGRSLVNDLFATGRARRAAGAGGKGLFDLNDFHLDGVDVGPMMRDAASVSDPEDAPFLAPEPALESTTGVPGSDGPSQTSELTQQAVGRARQALDRRPFCLLDERDAAVLRALIGFTRWHPHFDDGIRVGECFPSIQKLCTETGLARNTVRLALEELETCGFITRKRRVTNDRGKDMTYLFSLCESLVTWVTRGEER
jgi:hypothetical protein